MGEMTTFESPKIGKKRIVMDSRFGQTPHPSVNSLFKRTLDIVGSLVGLLILGLIFVPVAIAIRLDSPGPIFYSQKRCGLYGGYITIYKFRTMVKDADALKKRLQAPEGQPFFVKEGNDPRVTRVGKFLRRTSLDEFPQFWNILQGNMSLVGTRPPTLDEIRHYRDHHWPRLNVKPGLTGEWQVSGRSSIKDFEEVVRLDMRYQSMWHPLYDLQIIVRTLRVVLLREGAS
jgi:lipopolysaccharide/colanic/teichoic acid biosynthesis glycosyltransferase